MASFEWDASLWATNDVSELGQRAMVAGYADAVFRWNKNNESDMIYAEVTTGDDAATFKANVEAELAPQLLLSTEALAIDGNGVSTQDITVTDSRGAGAAGKVVKLFVPGSGVAVDKTQAVLDAAGRAVFTFGPSPSSNWMSDNMCCRFYYDNHEAPAVEFCVAFV